ncbi:MAG: hypothetical protein Q4E38_07380 [Eubacteriales bacterium]|nr:hypothetical protein [Eubacteriales bacterium]
MKKSNLDEMQEQQLLKIEHNGYWFCFTGLLVAIAVQTILSDDWKTVAGEWVVFMLANLYVMIGCMRAGIWDRRLRADARTNLVISLVAGLVMATIWFFVIERRSGNVRISLGGAAITFVLVAVLCFAALQLSAAAMKKRQAKLNAEPEDE